jgi:hypothetical protein
MLGNDLRLARNGQQARRHFSCSTVNINQER